jgi:oligopeptidase B
MDKLNPLQQQLYSEFISRTVDSATNIPEQIDSEFHYFTKTGKNNSLKFCRKSSVTNKEEIILDPSYFGYSTSRIGMVKISSDHHKIAFTVDKFGNEEHKAIVLNLDTKEIIGEIDSVVSVEWSTDNKTILYTTANILKRPSKVFRMNLETKEKILIYEETDEQYFLDVGITKDKKYLTINSNSKTSSEVRVINANIPNQNLRLIRERKSNLEYYVEHHRNRFIIITNEEQNGNYKIASIDENNFDDKMWETLIPTRENIKIEDVDIFENYIVLYERINGTQFINIISHDLKESHYIDIEDQIKVIEPGINLNFKSSKLRFSYSSPLIPQKIFDYEMNSRKLTLLKEIKITGKKTIN